MIAKRASPSKPFVLTVWIVADDEDEDQMKVESFHRSETSALFAKRTHELFWKKRFTRFEIKRRPGM